MRIFLVRHAESEGNLDQSVYQTKPNHTIDISDLGVEQAECAGEALKGYINTLQPGLGKSLIRMWTSPYKRTRRTAEIVLSKLTGNIHPWTIDCREHILLCEQQFGLFNGLTSEQKAERYPNEHALYKQKEESEGKFWARMPLGESRFDVATRIHQAFGTFHRDRDKHGIENIVVICHSITLRAFVMMWLHHPYEWIDKEPSSENCSIRLIEYGVDKGFIHPGGPVDAGLPNIKAKLHMDSQHVGKYGGPF